MYFNSQLLWDDGKCQKALAARAVQIPTISLAFHFFIFTMQTSEKENVASLRCGVHHQQLNINRDFKICHNK
jgi:hypothetical protein